MQLKKIHHITGTLNVVTGLHIGGSKDNIEIGGMDNPIIKPKRISALVIKIVLVVEELMPDPLYKEIRDIA